MFWIETANAATLSSANSTAGQLLIKVTAAIVNPIITLFFIGALCIFVYGIFEFIRGADNDEARSKGQKHMMGGIVGLFIMVAVFAIIRIIMNFVGQTGTVPNLWILN
jgi:hypothetical protein